MSRRESRRDSLANRQNDVLEEFETFKKKYLLVNKHIAKLNSSLNVKVEELSAQIASLNMENLRLRAAEQSMARKLQREKERTRRLVGEAEAAARTFLTQFTSILSSSSRPHSHPFPLSSASSHHRSSSASSTDLPSPSNPQPSNHPKAVKPLPKEVPRLSKAPQANTGQIQGINEDDEEGEADRTITLSTPPKKRREERRHSLPTPETPSGAPERRRHSTEDDDRTPARTSTPPPLIVPLPPLISKHPEGTFPPHIDLAAIGVSMRKSGVRRQSGLLNRFPLPATSAGVISASASVGDDLEAKMKTLERLLPPRPPSPIIGSPKANAEKVVVPSASEDEGVTTGTSASEMETDEWDDEVPRPPALDFAAAIAQSERYASGYSKVKPKDRRSAVSSSGLGSGDVQPLDECKPKEEKGKSNDMGVSLRDVTNEGAASASIVEAKARKIVLLPERADRENKKRLASTAFDEDDHPTLPSSTTATAATSSSSQLPPRSTTSSGSTVIVESYSVPLKDDNVEESGRSRRQRNSVNYAEPSLKVKMRKPRVEGQLGLKTRKSDGDDLATGYNSDGTGLVKERMKRKKSVKGLAELAAAASASDSEHGTPPTEASTTTKEAELKQAARRRLVSYHVSPESDPEAAGDEDEEYPPPSHGHAGAGGSSSSRRRLGSTSESEGLRRWSVAC